MQLNNPHMIDQTLRTTIPEIEVMYWITEDALYNGNNGKAKMMLEILLYAGKHKPELIKHGLQPIQRSRLKEITHEIYDNAVIKQRNPITIKTSIEPSKIPFKMELDLKEYLVKHTDVLNEALGEKIKIYGVEVVVEGEYKCDIVAESEHNCYPIELKIAQGNHAVVSQCSKYCYYLYRKLRYNHFKNVQGVIIANGFDSWSINEIRREGHWIFKIVPEGEKEISLLKID